MDTISSLSSNQLSIFQSATTISASSSNTSTKNEKNSFKLPRGIPEHLLADVTDQLSSLEGTPEFSKEYMAIVVLLKSNNPSQLEDFVHTMKEILGIGSKMSKSQNKPAQNQENPGGNNLSMDLNVRIREFTASVSSRRTTSDGVTEETSASITVSEIEVNARVRSNQNSQKQDPLTLDLNGNGKFDMNGKTYFDINADGKDEYMPFVSDGDGILVLDKNNNGRIDDGKEIFGDQNGKDNGFEELRRYDENNDNIIDWKDKVYNRLQLWGDFNKDGKNELKSLNRTGIESISLAYRNAYQYVNPDVDLGQIGSYRKDGKDNLA
jgi:hypothetical protein